MLKLIAELIRLYLPAGHPPADVLERHLSGQETVPLQLQSDDGMLRALMLPFDRGASGDSGQHWQALCDVANALQSELGLPAPAVSISGDKGFALWLSLESPVPVGEAQAFVAGLRRTYFPQVEPSSTSVCAAVELPPCVHQASGRWAAFINPGLGASFADESGLEMAPPLAGQLALLEKLESISASQFGKAMQRLQPPPPAATPALAVATPLATPEGLLLKDATLDDIVRHLHSLEIEPTFRHLIKRGQGGIGH